MSYLLPARVKPNAKLSGLGFPVASRKRFGLGAVLIPFRPRSLGRLGDDDDGLIAPTYDAPPAPLVLLPGTAYPTSSELTTTSSVLPNTLIAPGPQISNTQAYQNLLTTQQNSTDPLDYVSPQAAIAAGLPASQVNASWNTALAQYPTQAAALAAGIAPAIVTSLWASSRAAVPAASSSALSGSTLLYLAGGVALLAVLSARR